MSLSTDTRKTPEKKTTDQNDQPHRSRSEQELLRKEEITAVQTRQSKNLHEKT